MTDYAILDSPAAAQAEAVAVGEAVHAWLRDGHGCIEPVLSFCAGYARARTRAIHRGRGLASAVLDMARDDIDVFDLRIHSDEQLHLMGLIDSCVDEVSGPAVDQHRRRIAALARVAAVELMAETMPEVSSAPLVWVGVEAEAMVLEVDVDEVVVGDPAAVAARREVQWFATHQGGWAEPRYAEWLNEGKRWRQLVDRVEMMLQAEKIGAVA